MDLKNEQKYPNEFPLHPKINNVTTTKATEIKPDNKIALKK